MNGHIAPHNLVSISVFEDDHPCPNKHYHLVVYHKGDGIAPLVKPIDIKGEIYSLHQFRSDEWERVLQQSNDYIDKGADDFKHQLSAYNFTEDDEKHVVVVSWSKHHEDLIADLARGGC